MFPLHVFSPSDAGGTPESSLSSSRHEIVTSPMPRRTRPDPDVCLFDSLTETVKEGLPNSALSLAGCRLAATTATPMPQQKARDSDPNKLALSFY
jgi:hypothetical protein